MVVNQSYLLDTGLFVKYFRGDKRAIKLIESSLLSKSVSVLTITELLVGCKTKKEVQYTKEKLQHYIIFPIDPKIAEITSQIIRHNSDFFGKKVERGVVDAFIAATAIKHNLTLVTLNRKHFEKLKHPHFHCIILRESEKEWLVEK